MTAEQYLPRTPSLAEVTADDHELDLLGAGLPPTSEEPVLRLLAGWRGDLVAAVDGSPAPALSLVAGTGRETADAPAGTTRPGAARAGTSLPGRRSSSRAAVAIVAGAASFVLGSGAAAATVAAQPGDAFFPVRVGVGSAIGKPHPITQAEERLVQARQLLGSGTPDGVVQAGQLAREVDRLLADQPVTDVRQDLLTQAVGVEVLVATRTPVPPPVAPPPALKQPTPRSGTATSPPGATDPRPGGKAGTAPGGSPQAPAPSSAPSTGPTPPASPEPSPDGDQPGSEDDDAPQELSDVDEGAGDEGREAGKEGTEPGTDVRKDAPPGQTEKSPRPSASPSPAPSSGSAANPPTRDESVADDADAGA